MSSSTLCTDSVRMWKRSLVVHRSQLKLICFVFYFIAGCCSNHWLCLCSQDVHYQWCSYEKMQMCLLHMRWWIILNKSVPFTIIRSVYWLPSRLPTHISVSSSDSFQEFTFPPLWHPAAAVVETCQTSLCLWSKTRAALSIVQDKTRCCPSATQCPWKQWQDVLRMFTVKLAFALPSVAAE